MDQEEWKLNAAGLKTEFIPNERQSRSSEHTAGRDFSVIGLSIDICTKVCGTFVKQIVNGQVSRMCTSRSIKTRIPSNFPTII
jgi:hypothetical protein